MTQEERKVTIANSVKITKKKMYALAFRNNIHKIKIKTIIKSKAVKKEDKDRF